ncbi:MAG: tributyrin esterase [Planctomycetota bacterium]|nr:MAG: tributyrin esterase [Planctomycetota bacterium]REK46791.1 MAG: tributyrin esterase [Planctomycetota bacterium]
MVEIDARDRDIRDVNRQLRQMAEEHDQIVLLNPGARHNLAVGLTSRVELTVRGSAGYFCAGLCDGPTVYVEGNVGWGFGDNLMSGRLTVDGHAGAVCGVGQRAGDILVRGNLGSRAAQVMKGGSIVALGNAGYRAGSMMMGGTLIILGDAREALGEFLMDGEIYVGGSIHSLGEDAVEAELRDGDLDKVRELLARHGLEPPQNLRKIISDQRALRYAEYESGELLFEQASEEKAAAAAADGNRDTMNFDSD